MGPKVNSPRGEKVDTTGLHTPRVTSPRGEEVDTTGLHNPRVTSPRGGEVKATSLHSPQVILVKAASFTSVQTTTSISDIIMDPRFTVTKQTRTTRRWVRWG